MESRSIANCYLYGQILPSDRSLESTHEAHTVILDGLTNCNSAGEFFDENCRFASLVSIQVSVRTESEKDGKEQNSELETKEKMFVKILGIKSLGSIPNSV